MTNWGLHLKVLETQIKILVVTMLGSYYHSLVILLIYITNLALRHCHPITPASPENEIYCPEGEDWCENPEHYPEDGILEALTQEDSQLLDLLDDHNPHIIKEREAKMDNSSGNIFQDHSNICHSTSETYYIRAARNIKNQYQYIINIPEVPGTNQTFTQTIPMTICSSPDLSCGHGDLGGVETLCQQEYREIKLLIFTRDRRISLDTFAFKSCCVCFIKNEIKLK